MLSWTQEEKFHTPVFTSNHVLFCSLHKHKRLSLTRKVGFIHEWKNRINNSSKKLEGAVDKPYQTHMQNYIIFFTCVVMAFLRAGNPCITPQVRVAKSGGEPDPISCLNFEKIFLCDKYHKLCFTCHRFRRENFKLFILCAVL